MFTGIIETLGTVTAVDTSNNQLVLTVDSKLTPELKVDQSVAHNGVCLTVTSINDNQYTVCAVQETMDKTTVGNWQKGDKVNLERGIKLSDRLDGHIVQGHVDQVGTCTAISEEDGSWRFTFDYDTSLGNVTIEKGSITVSGVSLTVVNSKENEFSVAIIPYTIENTTFKYIKLDDVVNLEFDVIGKYVSRLTNS
mgnify:CR=1 FL=1